ncbi:MAG: glycosyltransferase [Desulfarculaceae bacterium]|nr:glycosyltransferase [Desulfarculaceae bacterium]
MTAREKQQNQKQQASVFEIHRLGDLVPPFPQLITVESREELGQWREVLEENLAALDDKIARGEIACSPDKRGDHIAEMPIQGQWRNGPPPQAAPWRETAPAADRPGPPPGDSPVASLRRRLAKVGPLRRLAVRLGLADQVQAAPDPGQLLRAVYCGPASTPPRQLEGLAPLLLSPGYGHGVDPKAQPCKPLPGSFAAWIAARGWTVLAGDAVLAFGDYPGMARDLGMLRGLLGPGQSIITPAGEAAERLAGWGEREPLKGGWLKFSRPAEEWLLERAWPARGRQWPRISVVVPSFNQSAFVRQALESLFSQGYPNLETIVLDPGSTDGTREILREYQSRITRLVLEPDRGQSDALQKGFELATGDIFTWLCTDDLLEPGALFLAAEAFEDYGVDLVVGGCRRINEQGEQVYTHFSAMPFLDPLPLNTRGIINLLGSVEKGHYFYQPEVFFTRNIWRAAGGFLHLKAYYGMDHDLWVRMAMAGGVAVQLPQLLASSRMQANQKTNLGGAGWPHLYQARNFLAHYQRIVEAMDGDC